MCQGSCKCIITPTAVALLRTQFCKVMWKKDMGKSPGNWPHTSLAHGKSRNIWIVVSWMLHRGHWSFRCWRVKFKYCLVGNQFRIAFQRKIWIFLGHCNFQIQFHNCLFIGTCFWWYRKVDAELTKQVPLLWGQRKVLEILAIWATRIPLIRCSSCGC